MLSIAILSLFRLYLPIGLIALVVIIGVAIGIHAQPYDERSPAAVLRPVYCRAPCFMSVRPGMTTMDRAITLLRNNAWVRQAVAIPNELHPNQVGWYWSEQAPDFLLKHDDRYDGQLFSSKDRIVSGISFTTSLNLLDIPPILGNPQEEDALIVVRAGSIPSPPDPTITAMVMLWFESLNMAVYVPKSCPYNTGFEHLTSSVTIADYDVHASVPAMYIVQPPKLMSSLRQLSLQACGF